MQLLTILFRSPVRNAWGLFRLTILFLWVCPSSLQAQLKATDPLAGSRKLITEEEMTLFYIQNEGSSQKTVAVTYDFDNNRFQQIAAKEASTGTLSASSDGGTDFASGSFFGDQFGEAMVYAYRSGRGNSGQATFRVDVQYALGGSVTPVTVAPNSFVAGDLYVQNIYQLRPQTQVVAGNFNDSPEDELFVVYTAADLTLRVQFYQLGVEALSGGEATISANRLDEYSTAPLRVRFGSSINQVVDAAALDVDFDGKDELVMAYWKVDFQQGDALMVDIFDVDDQNLIKLRSSTKVFDSKVNYCFEGDNTDFDFDHLTLKVIGGDFVNEFPGEEFVVGMVFNESCCSSGDNQGLYLLPLREERGTLVFPKWCSENNADKEFYTDRGAFNRDEPNSISLAAGDLDGDLDDELVVGHINVRVFNFSKGQDDGARNTFFMDQAAVFREDQRSYWDEEGAFLDNFVAVGNIDPLDGNPGNDFRAEILLGMQQAVYDEFESLVGQRFTLEVWWFPVNGPLGGVNNNLPEKRDSLEGILPVDGNIDIRRFSVGMADLDGGGFQLGVPTRTSLKGVLNPLVALNAPPTHFDVFGSTAYDVSNLYGDNAPPPIINHFNSEYEEITTNESTFETVFTSDWAVSAGVGPGFSYGGFSLSAKLTGTYGERFSKVSGSSRTISISEKRTALLDDQLLAYLVDYDIFEYPVFRPGEDEVLANVLVVILGDIQKTFIGARSPVIDYVVDHQHGNLLSYRAGVNEFTSSAGSVYRSFTGQEISKESGFNSEFEIKWTDATTNGVEKEVTAKIAVGADVGGAFKGIGLGASLEGSYSISDLQIQTSRYQESVSLRGYFGQGETTTIPGPYSYTVIPVTYWDENGSLVLDYAVSLSNIGFWKTFYDRYDPAFLLLDPFKPEKGSENPDTYNEADRYRTRDIRFTERPRPGGNTTIRARIHNYGLRGTPVGTGVEVCFYYLDPEGSNELVAIGCETIVNAFRGRLDALDQEIVEIPWTIPQTAGPDTKIVVLIDPNNTLPDEVHDYPQGHGVSNNIGWTCLFNPACSLPTSEEQIAPALSTSTREAIVVSNGLKVAPNPVQDWTWLMLDGQWKGELQIRVVDAMGRTLKVLGAQATGGDDRIAMDLGNLETGIYQLIVSDGKHLGRVSVMIVD